MRRIFSIVLIALLLPAGAVTHEGMFALVADPAMLDCSSGIEVLSIVNLYFYYVRGDGPYMSNGAEFSLQCSSPDIIIINPTWNAIMTVGNVEMGITVIVPMEGDCNEHDAVYLGMVPIMNYADTDTFTVTVSDCVWGNGTSSEMRITLCDDLHSVYNVTGNSYTFNGTCDVDESDPPLVTSADALSSSEVSVTFSEDIEEVSAQATSRYLLIKSGDPGSVISISAASLDTEGDRVGLVLDEPLLKDEQYSIFVDGVKDLEGNPVVPGTPYSAVHFTADNIATLLQSFSASYKGDEIRISWLLSDFDEGSTFTITRKETSTGLSIEYGDPQVSREGMSFEFVDRYIEKGQSYIYTVRISGDSGRILFQTDTIGTPVLPLALEQNVPNPFNPVTTVRYYLPTSGHVNVSIFDVSGRRVIELVDSVRRGGDHTVEWNGCEESGTVASSGLYFYRITFGKERITRKMVLLR